MSNVETLSVLERRLTMSVPVAEIELKVGEKLRNLARTVRMSGFRPGKVPLKLVAQQYGPQVRGEVIGDAVQQAFSSAVEAQQLRVAGYPKIERKEGGNTEQLEFNATFEVYPEVQLGDISTVSIERPTLEVGDAEIDRTIESLRKQRVTYETASRAAQVGDRVTIDFVGTIDGVEFPGGKASAFAFVLGERRMLPEFEQGVTGLAAGGSSTFALRFPDDYGSKEVAGKNAQFEVKVSGIEQALLPQVDAEFAKSLGVADGDLAKMRADIKENVEREVAQRLASMRKQRVMQALLDSTKPEVPNALVEIEQSRLVEAARADLQSRGLKDADKVPIDPALFRDQGVRRVTLGLILAEVVKQKQLSGKPEQVRKLVEDYARGFEQPFEVVKWVYSQSERLSEFEGLAVEENVVNWVLASAKVEDKPIAFEELMGNAA